MALAQYGGKISKDASYRVFTKYLDDGHLPDLNGENARDGWHLLHGGFRVDDTLSKKDALTVQGDLYTGREGASIIHIFSVDPPDTDVLFTSSRLAGGNVLGRWSHEQSNRSNTTLQLYFDNYTRSGPEAFESRDTFDIDLDHHLTLSRRHDLIWGAGYRRSSDHTVGTIDQAFIPADRTLQFVSFFAQDEITLKPDRLLCRGPAGPRRGGTPTWMWGWRHFPTPRAQALRSRPFYSGLRKSNRSMLWPGRPGIVPSQAGEFLSTLRHFSTSMTTCSRWNRKLRLLTRALRSTLFSHLRSQTNCTGKPPERKRPRTGR